MYLKISRGIEFLQGPNIELLTKRRTASRIQMMAPENLQVGPSYNPTPRGIPLQRIDQLD